MSRENKRCAYVIALQEVGSTVRSLYRDVSDYRDRMNITPSRYWNALIDPSWAPLPVRWLLRLAPYRDVNGDEWNLCHFWDNFEIADLGFFREDGYRHMMEHLDKLGGFYYERWGDASSRSFTLDEVVANAGPLFLTDFGETRTQAEDWRGLIQPDPFRSPEVILKMPWTPKTDIWNLGVMAWRMFEDHLLFEDRDSKGNHSDAQLLAHITAILGPAPLSIVNRSPDRALYWNEKGEWTGEADIPDDSIEESDERLLDKDLDQFAAFMRKMLQWDPDHRQSAAELLQDEWLLDISD
ncbi:kinase-like protein, partial [Aureobasidium melanogenum]